METKEIWTQYKAPLYFFILKRIQHREDAEEVLQNTFVKIHQNLHKLRHPEKVRAWVFQIARNELNDSLQKRIKTTERVDLETPSENETPSEVCCFEQCIQKLPHIYKRAVELVYLEGKSQKQASTTLAISLSNIKARIRRGKQLLADHLKACCGYTLNAKGKLVGTPDCALCGTQETI